MGLIDNVNVNVGGNGNIIDTLSTYVTKIFKPNIVDGKNVNEMLLKEGLAEIMYMPPSEFYPYDWADSNTHVANSHSTSSSSAHQESTSSASDTGNYVGNSNSGKFHNPSCQWALKIASYNKVTFNSREDAINQGYEPCKVCNP